jgi:tetratricopeptide (TPR) repeat protein
LNHSKKQVKTATNNFKKAHKYKETKGKSAYQLAVINLHYKKPAEAEKYFHEALSLDVKKSNCLLHIAEICFLKKNYNGAIKHLNDASEIVVLEERHEYTASNLYCESSNFVLARKHLKNAFKKKNLRSKIIIKKYQINKLLRIQQNEEDILTTAIKLNPDYFESYLELGLYFIKENQIDSAQRMLTKACHNNWEHIQSHFELGKIEFKLKNTSKAKMHFEIVLDLDSNHSEAIRMIERIS